MGSPTTIGGKSAATCPASRSFFWRAAGSHNLTTSWTSSGSENGTASICSLPASILDRSSTSFSSRNKASAEFLTALRYSRCSGVKRVPSVNSVMPMITFMGVRISWLTFARNSPLARLAASAASLACSKACCSSRRRVTSWAMPTQCVMPPSSSNTGVTPIDSQ